MQPTRAAAALLAITTVTGCYRATINTGLPPSTIEIEEEWAHSWLGGLVPPDEMDVAGQCPSGVAQVETELSFLNQLAAAVTWGIYTPMTLRVVCALPAGEVAGG